MSNNSDVRVWVSKYAYLIGILECEGSIEDDGTFRPCDEALSNGVSICKLGEWAKTEEEALEQAVDLCTTKMTLCYEAYIEIAKLRKKYNSMLSDKEGKDNGTIA